MTLRSRLDRLERADAPQADEPHAKFWRFFNACVHGDEDIADDERAEFLAFATAATRDRRDDPDPIEDRIRAESITDTNGR